MSVPLVTFSGLATGIDTKTLISSLVKLERAPIDALNAKQASAASLAKRLTAIRTQLATLHGAVDAIDIPSEVLAASAKSSDDAAVHVTAASGAAVGRFAVTVTALAREERSYSAGFDAKDQAGLVAEGALDITIGATTKTVTITSTDTLETIASKINDSGADVSVAIVFDGAKYRLMVAGKSTGASGAVTFGETDTDLGLSLGGAEVQSARDAAFSIDGFAMTRSTNVVSDALAGVTLDLRDETSTAATVEIARDPTAIETKIRAFVDAYNTIATSIDAESRFGGTARLGDSLSGDGTLRALQSRLRAEVTSTTTGAGTYSTLGSIGVALDRSGKLSIDSAKLHAAIASDPASVARVVAGSSDGATEGVMDRFARAIDAYAATKTGALSARIIALEGRSRRYDDDIARLERHVDAYQQNLTSRFAALEKLVSGLQSQGAQLTAAISSASSGG